jgi:hypothetical protein
LEEEYKSEIEDVKAKFLLKKEIKRSLVGIVVSDKNLKSVSIKVQVLELEFGSQFGLGLQIGLKLGLEG